MSSPSGTEEGKKEIDDLLIRLVDEQCREQGTDNTVSVNGIRTAAEKERGLITGFLRGNRYWNSRSKEVITAAWERNNPDPDQVEPDPKSSKKKRKSSEHDDHPRKKRKEPVGEFDFVVQLDDEGASSTKTKSEVTSKVRRRPTVISSDVESDDTGKDEEETKESPPKELASTSHSSPEPAPALESDSDMSVLIDDGPPRKKTKAAKSGAKAKAKATKPKAPKAAQSKSDGSTSQESEIKRLQGWLIKCGIRKLWHRELAPYATPGEKIGHLKEMLRDAGMEGRYSAEKARQIKEQRELAADLEAVTEGNKVWGKKKEAEQDETKETKEKRGRTLAKGFKDLAFLEDDDEESD